MMRKAVTICELLFGLVFTFSLPAQQPTVQPDQEQSGQQQAREERNLNLYYRYPLAAGADFHSWSPLTDYGREYSIYEVSGSVRYPLPETPLFQPMVGGGYLNYDSLDQAQPERWDHTKIFGGVGMAFLNRLSKVFELGAEVTTGYTYSYFRNVADEPVGYGSVYGTVSPRFTLIPSFNFAINLEPKLRYSHSLGEVNDFNGFSYSIGIGAEYRFGQDPDAPQAEIRSLRISKPNVDTAFAAMQSYYVDHPIGSVTIENTESHKIEDIQVSFFQNSYMDSPTPSARIDALDPGEERKVDLFASFNSEVFKIEGVTPLTGEVIVTYKSRGRPAEQRQSVTYDLQDKTAITWDDNRKMGAFITPADSAVQNYTSFIQQAGKGRMVDSASGPLQTAMLAYHALVELGVIYQVDPSQPFTEVQNNPQAVDSVSLPRDTLTQLAGDCDDLTALYATMLETVGIDTAFITTPGHIYVAFNTRVPAHDYRIVHPDRDMLLTVEDEIWVPVEVTTLGDGDFLDAWRYGIDEWRKYSDDTDKRGFYLTNKAQSVYRPVGLRQTDLGLQYGSASAIAEGFSEDFETLTDTIIGSIRQTARERDDKRSYNRLGIYSARLGRYDQALRAFERAAEFDQAYLEPRVNQGSVHFLQENYSGALQAFRSAMNALERRGNAPPSLKTKVFINVSKAYYELGQYDQADQFFQRAAEVNPEAVSNYEYLARGDTGPSATRASEAGSGPEILFAE